MSDHIRNASAFNLTLGKVLGIPIRIHWTFFAFLIWIAVSEYSGAGDPITEIVFVLLIFFCVLLHELGHSAAAIYHRIKVRDITLYPIGGVASILGDPTPKQEFVVAIAGPLVTALIALALYPYLTILDDSSSNELAIVLSQLTLIDKLFIVNVMLLVFNMIPAYPMDGGRVLRSLLAMAFGMKLATIISARLGQLLSILMGFYGFYSSNVIMMFIALLVFSNATQEIRYQRIKEALKTEILNKE